MQLRKQQVMRLATCIPFECKYILINIYRQKLTNRKVGVCVVHKEVYFQLAALEEGKKNYPHSSC